MRTTSYGEASAGWKLQCNAVEKIRLTFFMIAKMTQSRGLVKNSEESADRLLSLLKMYHRYMTRFSDLTNQYALPKNKMEHH